MSASTGTIQRQMGQRSIFGAVAVAAVTLLAALGIAWGALNLTASKNVATPVPAPLYLDKGSRAEIAPQPAPAPGRAEYTPYVTPKFNTLESTIVDQALNGKGNSGSSHPRHIPAR